MYTVGIITISDKGAAGRREDKSGPKIRQMLPKDEYEVVSYKIIPDERKQIADKENNGFRTVRGTCHDFVLYREHPACFCGNSGRKTGTAKYGDRAAALPDRSKRGGLRQYTPYSAFRIFVW